MSWCRSHSSTAGAGFSFVVSEMTFVSSRNADVLCAIVRSFEASEVDRLRAEIERRRTEFVHAAGELLLERAYLPQEPLGPRLGRGGRERGHPLVVGQAHEHGYVTPSVLDDGWPLLGLPDQRR